MGEKQPVLARSSYSVNMNCYWGPCRLTQAHRDCPASTSLPSSFYSCWSVPCSHHLFYFKFPRIGIGLVRLCVGWMLWYQPLPKLLIGLPAHWPTFLLAVFGFITPHWPIGYNRRTVMSDSMNTALKGCFVRRDPGQAQCRCLVCASHKGPGHILRGLGCVCSYFF